RTAGRRWDIVVDLRGSALAWLLWARGRFVIGKGDPAEHWVRQLGRLLGLDPPPSPVVWTSPVHDRAAEALVPPGSPGLAIGTGLLRLAAAAATPPPGLFGPSPVERYAPWGRSTAVAVTTPSGTALFPPGFDRRTTDTLMDSLSVAAVERAARDLWHRALGQAA